MKWSEQTEVSTEGGGKTFMVETALMEDHVDRFHLWCSGGRVLPTMWGGLVRGSGQG